MKPFAHLFVQILMVFDSPGGCCEAICTCVYEILIVLDSPGGCCESICAFVYLNIDCF